MPALHCIHNLASPKSGHPKPDASKCKSPASQTRHRRRGNARGRDGGRIVRNGDATAYGGAYINDEPVDIRMNHISIGDKNEDNFVPIEYSDKC